MKVKALIGLWLFLLIPNTLLLISTADVTSRDSFKWLYNCDYQGSDIDAIVQPIKSLMRCAEACFDNNNCTFFTYSSKSSICSLKKVTDITFSQIAVSTQQQGSLCGLIDKRLRSSANSSSVSLFGLQWTTSPDGSYLLSPGCSFPVPDNTIITTSTFDACAQECKGRPQQCTYFVFAPGNSYCLMNKKSDPQFSGRAIGTTCGIVSQYSSSLFNNVECMTKCDFAKSNSNTTYCLK